MIHKDGLRSGILLFLLALAGCGTPPPGMDAAGPSAALKPASAGLPEGGVNPEQVARGRKLVLTRDCAGCHGGGSNPASEGWLAGADEAPTDSIGGFKVWASNLTPDAATGLGRVSERQIFNALRYGLRPGTTPDVEITSAVPGQGNHPRAPDYLSPVMPWAYWRYMSDQELWDIAAYLKHGRRPTTGPACRPWKRSEGRICRRSRHRTRN